MNRQFPPEIVQLIVEASLDPYDIFTAMDDVSAIRYAILKSYSLLNSTWYGASQPKLLRSVELHTDGSVEAFLELAQWRGGTVEGVRDFYFKANWSGDSSALPKLLKSIPHLVNLYCYSGTVVVGDLARLKMLRRLELESNVVAGSLSSSLRCLPHLQRLSMNEVTLGELASHFLTPAFLPQLRCIDIDGEFDRIAPLIPQLEIITLDPFYVDYTLLSRAKSLLLLPLPPYSHNRLAMFSTLPSLPPFLHIRFASWLDIDFDLEVASALQELLEAKNSGLRVVLLHDHGIDDSVKAVIQRLEERGTRVQLHPLLDFDGAVEVMEKIRGEEKRAVEQAE